MDMREGELLLGSFAGVGPSCGICVLEGSSEQVFEENMKHTNVPPLIQRLLIGTGYNLQNQKNYFDLTQHSTTVRQVEPLQGRYIGYSLLDSDGKESISVDKFQIYDGYRIDYETRSVTYPVQGYVAQVTKDAIICLLHFDSGSDHFRIILNLRKDAARDMESIPAGSLVGTFGGMRTYDQKPIAGRLIMVPMVDGADRVLNHTTSIFVTGEKQINSSKLDHSYSHSS